MNDESLRPLLRKILNWEDAHVNFDNAINNIPEKMRGIRHKDIPYSLWELIEHIRLSQYDILEFCRNPDYKEMPWPDAYWPDSAAPESSDEWDRSISKYKEDRESLKKLVSDENLELASEIPHGDGQTYIREILLVADHNAYHVGQIVLLRKLLGIWE
ncbi:DinB family protein [Mangrovivirga sp. M17]|uniref:DinB family protein n=1 Tax=Mangrovivirga halotolerans TaxID=2993936 RepID=A0ABT3RNW6_9BACT|nr:DinB family protein [Mangrovivirga halotolerans]MCX2743166.1 DinB family protein [Mangrovivirga halotolerans]